MSSLWTPGGEVPVDRDRGRGGAESAPAGDAGGGPGEPSEEDLRGRAAELQRFLLEAPAADVVAQHAMGLYELAAIHLSQDQPRLGDARLAIDAFAALVEGLEGRLGTAEGQLREVLPQLQMAYVQAADRVKGSGADAASSAAGDVDAEH